MRVCVCVCVCVFEPIYLQARVSASEIEEAGSSCVQVCVFVTGTHPGTDSPPGQDSGHTACQHAVSACQTQMLLHEAALYRKICKYMRLVGGLEEEK